MVLKTREKKRKKRSWFDSPKSTLIFTFLCFFLKIFYFDLTLRLRMFVEPNKTGPIQLRCRRNWPGQEKKWRNHQRDSIIVSFSFYIFFFSLSLSLPDDHNKQSWRENFIRRKIKVAFFFSLFFLLLLFRFLFFFGFLADEEGEKENEIRRSGQNECWWKLDFYLVSTSFTGFYRVLPGLLGFYLVFGWLLRVWIGVNG